MAATSISDGGVGWLEIATGSSWKEGWFTYHANEDTIRQWIDQHKVRGVLATVL
jgi:hypothetical protein